MNTARSAVSPARIHACAGVSQRREPPEGRTAHSAGIAPDLSSYCPERK